MVKMYNPEIKALYYRNGEIEFVEDELHKNNYIMGFENIGELAALIKSHPELGKDLKKLL